MCHIRAFHIELGTRKVFEVPEVRVVNTLRTSKPFTFELFSPNWAYVMNRPWPSIWHLTATNRCCNKPNQHLLPENIHIQFPPIWQNREKFAHRREFFIPSIYSKNHLQRFTRDIFEKMHENARLCAHFHYLDIYSNNILWKSRWKKIADRQFFSSFSKFRKCKIFVFWNSGFPYIYIY